MKTKIWLSSPHMGGNEINYIKQAFEENWIAPLGPNVEGFEKDLETFTGDGSNVACVSSGTAAIHLALIMSGVSHGDEVICQSFTFSGSANPIMYQGATPVFIDSEPQTWNMCPSSLEEAIKDRLSKGVRPKAIILVHLYGMPAKITEILEIAKRYEITLIEDAAEAIGSTYNGQKCGSFGDFGILSFNGNKLITTSGGGALVCKTPEHKKRAIFLSTQARDYAVHYQHSEVGYNYRMSNIIAGIGRGQMEVLEERIEARRENNRMYNDLFANVEGVSVLREPDNSVYSNHWLTAIIVDKGKTGYDREDIRNCLLADNIESRPLWKPMHMQPVFTDAPFYGNGLAEDLFTNGLCLPSGSNLTKDDKERIKSSLSKLI